MSASCCRSHRPASRVTPPRRTPRTRPAHPRPGPVIPLPALAVLALALALPAVLLPATPAASQCILANPSFEVDGSGGAAFGGWNQFGAVGATAEATHGSQAALVRGPDTGGWDVSAVWQRQDSAPGQRWRITGHVRHRPGAPLTGGSVALVNVEWRDAAGSLLDYQSLTVADPGAPAGIDQPFTLTSDPAPQGTAAVHVLFGVLQEAGAPAPEVVYDQVTVHATDALLDDLQWHDFPGGRTLEFAGRTWRVKGPGYYGPGPNVFCDGPECVWVDGAGRLHLTLADRGAWQSTEVVLEEALGYGDYVITTTGRLDLLDPQAILGLFLWQYGPCWDPAYLWWNPYNEVDIEYGRWGDPDAAIAQFVAQPYDWPGNLERFDLAFAPGEEVSHAMRWLPDRVEYRVWRGGSQQESPATLVHAWTYTGPHLPRPEQPRLHLNLWKLEGTPASDQEVVFTDFTFTPAGATGVADGGGGGGPGGGGGAGAAGEDPELLPGPAGRLLPAAPNPFNPRTTLRFTLARAGPVELAVHDLAGRHLRTLISGERPAGTHRVRWDGRTDTGRALPSGVYLVRLRSAGVVESQRVTLVR